MSTALHQTMISVVQNSCPALLLSESIETPKCKGEIDCVGICQPVLDARSSHCLCACFFHREVCPVHGASLLLRWRFHSQTYGVGRMRTQGRVGATERKEIGRWYRNLRLVWSYAYSCQEYDLSLYSFHHTTVHTIVTTSAADLVLTHIDIVINL